MGKRKTGDKLGDIRRATIAEVVEHGSSSASVNAIARRAGLAVGTIYRYHENKEHLLRSVYLAVKTDLHDAMMTAASEQDSSKTKIRAMWFAILDFAHAQSQAFLFSEVIVNDKILTGKDRGLIEAMAVQSRRFIENAITDGTVGNRDVLAIVTVLAAPVLQLGREAALSGEPPDAKRVEDVFALCWRAIEA